MHLSEDGTRKLDSRIAASRLLDAAELALQAALPLEERDGWRAARVDLRQGGAILEWTPPDRDLRRFDMLALTLRTEGGPVRARLHLKIAGRTQGLPADDSLDSGHSDPSEYPTWGSCIFPYENFLIYGMPELAHPVERIVLHLNGGGTVWIAEMIAFKRDRAPGPRLTDRGLLAELDLDASDPTEALRHFKTRAIPKDIYSNPPAAPSGWTRRNADRICEHFINGYDVGHPVNWRANPNGYLEWMHAFNRTSWINELLRAYAVTENPKYVRTLDELWLSWLRANPEPVGHNGGGDPAWETLSTAVRIYGSWLRAWFNLLDDEHLSDATRIEILKSFFGHAEHLLRYQGPPNNWLIVESSVLYVLSVLFPEFRRASLWHQEGAKRLAGELERQVFPDGADWELSPGYHMMASRGFLEAFELAQKNGLTLPPVFAKRLPRTFDYIAGMTRPDGTLPSVNDSGGYRGRNGGDFLALGARLFSRPELIESPEGPYCGKSRAFPDSGFHVLASGKDRNALWMLFDGGEVGQSHRHDDALSIEVFAHGYPFIVDPGITGYLNDNWTACYRTAFAHSTVLVNGASQRAAAVTPRESCPSARGTVECVFGDTADFVRAMYCHGYHDQADGITHTRAVLFVRGAYWLIFDEVAGDGAREMEARFQFVPLRLVLEDSACLFRTLRQNLPNLELMVLSPREGARLSVVTGETDPVGGWVSDGEDKPAPQARISVGESPLRLATLIYPFAGGVNSGVDVRLLSKATEDVCRLEIRRGREREDRIDYAWNRGAVDAGGTPDSPLALRTKATALALRGGTWNPM